jgi:hypothetical protein
VRQATDHELVSADPGPILTPRPQNDHQISEVRDFKMRRAEGKLMMGGRTGRTSPANLLRCKLKN